MQIKTFGNISVSPGEKYTGFYTVPGTDFSFPLTIIYGASPGNTVLITAGIHGGEYPPIVATIELAAALSPEKISGCVVLIHPVNTSAFEAIVPFIVPESGENLNRVFPGKKDGSVAERIAYELTHTFQLQADFYLDLHSGDLHEALTPFLFYPGACDGAVMMASKSIAEKLTLPYMLQSSSTTGAYNSAAALGVPSLLIERGQLGVWSQSEVEAYKLDVYLALQALGILPETITNTQPKPIDVANAIYIPVTEKGCWHPAVKPGDFVQKGDVLGAVKDFFGNVRISYTAEMDGIVLHMQASLALSEDAPLLVYAQQSAKI